MTPDHADIPQLKEQVHTEGYQCCLSVLAYHDALRNMHVGREVPKFQLAITHSPLLPAAPNASKLADPTAPLPESLEKMAKVSIKRRDQTQA